MPGLQGSKGAVFLVLGQALAVLLAGKQRGRRNLILEGSDAWGLLIGNGQADKRAGQPFGEM